MPLSELRSTFPVPKNPANSKRAVSLTPEQFHYAFTNTLTREESDGAYDRYAAPAPARVLLQGGLANFTHDAATTYDFPNDDRAPLLFISGGSDHILPPAVQRENYERNEKHSSAGPAPEGECALTRTILPRPCRARAAADQAGPGRDLGLR